MPIKGLTDKPAMFPEIGRIRKGAPKGENKPGKDLDYFRVEFDEKEVEAIEVFKKAYGEEPDELNVLLPFNTVDENFEAWREAYVAGGMTHRCDGEQIMYEIDKEGKPIVTNGIPYKSCDRSIDCKPTGRLKILIPELRRLAFLTVLTGSLHDVMNLSSQLEALRVINGRLAGVPFILRRRPKKISTPSGSKGKRARRVKSLLSIEADPTWVDKKLTAMQIAALPPIDEPLMIDAPEEAEIFEEIEAEIIEEPKPEVKKEPQGNGVVDNPESNFWNTVYNIAKLDQETGHSILNEAKGDFEEAIKIVRERHV